MGAEQRACIASSLRSIQVGHQRRSCNEAPSKESITAPPKPATATATALSMPMTPVTRQAPITVLEPPNEATRPATVTPPEVPEGTRWPVSTSRGGAELRRPISVAQVSAAAVASAEAKRTGHAFPGITKWHTAHNPGIDPFARTCLAVRRGESFLADSEEALRPIRDRSDDVRKKTSNGIDHATPPEAKMIAPSMVDAMAARTVSAPASVAPAEMSAARQRPRARRDGMGLIVPSRGTRGVLDDCRDLEPVLFPRRIPVFEGCRGTYKAVYSDVATMWTDKRA